MPGAKGGRPGAAARSRTFPGSLRRGPVLLAVGLGAAVVLLAALAAGILGGHVPAGRKAADIGGTGLRPVGGGAQPLVHPPGPAGPANPAVPSMAGMPGMPADGSNEDVHAGTDSLGLQDNPAAVANLGVLDQVSNGRSMAVGVAEVDGTPGWVVVQREVDHRPGPVVGITRRRNGQAGDSPTVRFTTSVASGAYWVSLHRDLGRQRVYEFPGPDLIAVAAGSPLQRRVLLHVR